MAAVEQVWGPALAPVLQSPVGAALLARLVMVAKVAAIPGCLLHPHPKPMQSSSQAVAVVALGKALLVVLVAVVVVLLAQTAQTQVAAGEPKAQEVLVLTALKAVRLFKVDSLQTGTLAAAVAAAAVIGAAAAALIHLLVQAAAVALATLTPPLFLLAFLRLDLGQLREIVETPCAEVMVTAARLELTLGRRVSLSFAIRTAHQL